VDYEKVTLSFDLPVDRTIAEVEAALRGLGATRILPIKPDSLYRRAPR